MKWLPRLAPAKGPMQDIGGAPQPHFGPPCSQLRRLALCLWPSSAAWAPLGGSPPSPQLPPSPSFSSSS